MDGEFVAELAEAWKPAADFKSYTVKIRKGVKFHDGKDVTVADVVYSIDEIWKKYASAAAMTDFAGVAPPDSDTVVIDLQQARCRSSSSPRCSAPT
jgi:peptide/nickel transport system substrate-binding protein